MKIAYFIHSHSEPNLCIRLIERLQHIDVNFYIHWDKKNVSEISALQSYASKYSNVHFYSEYEVFWMGISLLKASLMMYEIALKSEIKYDYFILLSGQDYPIKTNKQILEFFQNSTKDYISLNKLHDLGGNFPRKVEKYHWLECKWWNPRSPVKNKWLFKLYFGIYINRLMKYLPKRKMFADLTPYFGSNWYAFTRETIKYVVEYCQKNPGYMKYMEKTESPEEIFFHTLVANSHRMNNVSELDEYKEFIKLNPTKPTYNYKWGSLKYMVWDHPNRAKPATLDMQDFESLKASHFLFCRKVSEKDAGSLELINHLDHFLDHQ